MSVPDAVCLMQPCAVESKTENNVGFNSETPFSSEDHQKLAEELLSVKLEDGQNQEGEKRDGETAERISNGGINQYPLRPYAGDCVPYMKTGTCKYKLYCRYNHPVKRVNQGVREIETEGTAKYAAKIECKYYLTPEGCKFGRACRYKHTQETNGIGEPELNFLGLPIRVGEKECPFFMRSGSCGYGAECIFHHPDPSDVEESTAERSAPDTSTGTSKTSLENHDNRSNLLTDSAPSQLLAAWAPHMMMMKNSLPVFDNQSPALPDTYSTPKIEHLDHESNKYQSSFHRQEKPVQSRFVPFASNSLEEPDTLYSHQHAMIEEVPERHGQPECPHFMKTGYCKFKSACRYHHPISALRAKNQPLKPFPMQENLWNINANPELEYFSSKVNVSSYHHHQQFLVDEFPQRPGQPECSYFIKTGDCSFRSACRYHHPKNLPYKLPISALNSENFRPISYTMQQNSSKSYKAPEGENFSNIVEVSSYLQQQLNADEFPERPGQPVCSYFMKTGFCKYRSACRYHHPKNLPSKLPITAPSSENLAMKPFPSQANLLQFNAASQQGENLMKKIDISSHQQQQLQGNEFPDRPGLPECSYFMKTGYCKFKSSCRYHHPKNQPTDFPTRVKNAEKLSWKPISLPENSWKIKAAPEGENLTKEVDVSSNQQEQPQGNEFPEQPGGLECSYSVKTGECHHPKDKESSVPVFSLSDKGLPLRPGSNICAAYKQYGICKLGIACLFDHREDESSNSFVGSVPNVSSSNESANDAESIVSNFGNESEVVVASSLPISQSIATKTQADDIYRDG